MTREEAIKIFLDRGGIKLEGGTYFDGGKWREAIKVISDYLRYEYKALEQEPCEDCISRQAVLDIIDSYSESRSNVEDVTQDIISDIVMLPSVTPQPKMGRWIDDKCSVCGLKLVDLQESGE